MFLLVRRERFFARSKLEWSLFVSSESFKSFSGSDLKSGWVKRKEGMVKMDSCFAFDFTDADQEIILTVIARFFSKRFWKYCRIYRSEDADIRWNRFRNKKNLLVYLNVSPCGDLLLECRYLQFRIMGIYENRSCQVDSSRGHSEPKVFNSSISINATKWDYIK